MESNTTTNDPQTTSTVPISNSSSRRKQSKPNRLEHVVVDSPAPLDPILPTQYHVAAEQQQESALIDDESDRISLNCEDGSLSSHSPDEHYAMEDILNRSRRSSQPSSRSNEKHHLEENIEHMLIESNEEQQANHSTSNVLDFSLKLDETNKNLFNSTNRPRALNPSGKSRSLKRKHPNGNSNQKNGTSSGPTRIFHADAFCTICRKEFCNKYFLKTHLANKHGIFDHQASVSSLSTPSMVALPGSSDLNHEANLQHSFTMVSTLLQNGQEDFSSSPTSDLVENQRAEDGSGGENDTGLSSLRHQMNGVIAGDDENHLDQESHANGVLLDNDDDDEQDGTHSNALIHLPQQIGTNLRNENPKRSSISTLNDEDDDDEQEMTTNSPTNSLDYPQQQASSSQTLTATSTGNVPRQSSAKLPEDFCDLCQKHFCNKYYLRKHKLDVHGVQTDCNIKPYKRIDNSSLSSKASSSVQQISSAIQLPSSFPNVTFSPTSVQQSLGMLLNPIFSPLVQSQGLGGESSGLPSNKRRYTENSNESTSSSSLTGTGLGKSSFPPSLLTVASDVAQVFANQLASVANNSNASGTSAIVGSNSSTSSPSTSGGSKSQISTCHLCGKKFQTNDYLQLHLMNKHQITGDLQTYDSLDQRLKTSNLIKSSNGSLNSSTVKKIKLETTETPSSNKISSASPAETINSNNNASVIPGIVDTYFAAKMADRVSCNICLKQVCNKYFLKTHKLKVHGVGPDSVVGSSSSGNVLNSSETTEDGSEQQQQQQHSRSSFDSSPPQLVVDEMNLNAAEPGVIPSPDALTASVNTFIGGSSHSHSSLSTDSNEQSKSSVCELCSKSFPTKFLHVHMNNVHGIQQAMSTVNGSTSNTKSSFGSGSLKRSLTNGGSGTSPVRLKQTPQVQLRVTCQVCKKELCNKYFLRAHMRNVHNITVDDFRLIQQQSSTSQLSPRSDCSSSKQTFSLSSNLLSSTSTNPTDSNQISSLQLSSFNDSESNHFNGHTTDSNESENLTLTKDIQQFSSGASPLNTNTTTIKSATNDKNNHLLSMQPFLVESDDDLYKDLFVPCMVYLPCRHRVTKPLEISLRLKPVDNTTSTAAAVAAASATAD